ARARGGRPLCRSRHATRGRSRGDTPAAAGCSAPSCGSVDIDSSHVGERCLLVNPLLVEQRRVLKNRQRARSEGNSEAGMGRLEVAKVTTFQSIGVRARTADLLRAGDITEPNTVQRETIPALLARRDCVLEAPTG